MYTVYRLLQEFTMKRGCVLRHTYILVLEIMVSGEDGDAFYDHCSIYHASQDSPLDPRHSGIFR